MHHSISHQSTAQRSIGRRPLNFVRQPSRLGKEHASKSLLSLLRPFHSVAFYSFFMFSFFCMLALTARAQESFEVKGLVIDETGETVIGATVTIQNKPGIGTVDRKSVV